MSDPLHVAAFTSDPEGGNLAGVVIGEHGAPSEMMAVAADVGHSETAFLAPTDDRMVWNTRYFAPQMEVDFCGHATIAAGSILGTRFGAGTYLLHTNVGEIPVDVTLSNDGAVHVTLTSVAPSQGKLSDAALSEALYALGYDHSDLDPSMPTAVSNAGVNHLMIPLKDRATLAHLDYDFDALRSLMEQEDWTTVDCLVRSGGTEFHVRNAFPVGGIVEDPATGAAAAALGGYLVHYGLVVVPTTIQVYQGYDMGSPSQITVEISSDPQAGIRVSGSAVIV